MKKSGDCLNNDIAENIFIFLGHDGLFNSSMWMSQIFSDSKNGAILYIQKEKESMSEIELRFCASTETCAMESEWGSPNLVAITIQLIKEALDKYANAKTFWIVSGTCIPVVTSEEIPSDCGTIFERGPQNSFYIHDGRINMNKHHEETNPITINAAMLKKFQTAIPGFKRGLLRYCSQWCCLSKADTLRLIVFDFVPFGIIDDFLRDEEQFPELSGRIVRHGCANAMFAPDEYYFSLALGLLDQKSTLSTGTTSCFSFFNCHLDASPILFTSLDGYVHQEANCGGFIVSVYFTLREAIVAVRCLREKSGLRNLITMRKVAELELIGQNFFQIISECKLIVVSKIREEVVPVMVNVVKSDLGVIHKGQNGFVQKNMRKILLVSAAIHKETKPESTKFRRTKAGKRIMLKEKYAKRNYQRSFFFFFKFLYIDQLFYYY